MRSWSTAGSAADPETSRRALPSAPRQRGVLLGVRDEAVVHGRHAEDHRRALRERRGDALRGEAPEVMRGAAAADRPEDADDQAVHVEERQPVGDDVVGRPLPRVGQRVEVGGDRAARQDGALGRAGGARGVDDERRVPPRRARARGPRRARRGRRRCAAASASAAGSSTPGAHRIVSGALSSTMWPSSRSPAFGLMGTAATPARSAPMTATHGLGHRAAPTRRRAARPPPGRPRAPRRRAAAHRSAHARRSAGRGGRRGR